MKRKARLITACTECTRRKQKCDRRKPCDHCIARGVSERCAYQDPSASDAFESLTPYAPTKSSPVDHRDSAPVLVYTEREAQLGYTSTGYNNATISINQLLNDRLTLEAVTTQSIKMQSDHPSWTQYWKLASQLPPPRVINNLVTLYFTTINWQYCILERYYFGGLLQQWLLIQRNTVTELKQDLLCFPALLYQVLAVALHFAPPHAYATAGNEQIHQTTCTNLSRCYSDVGVNMMNLLGENGRGVNAIEHYFMRAWWLKTSGRKADAWHSIGTSIRLAQTLGIHGQLSPPTSLGGFWENEYKRRLWLNLFVWDSGMSLLLGRPCMIQRSDCNINRPLNCDIPEEPLTTNPDQLVARGFPFLFAERLFQYDMACKMHDARDLGLERVTSETYVLIQDMQNQLQYLLSGLPPFLRPHDPDTSFDELYHHLPLQRETVLTATLSAIYSLHRPHLASHEESRREVLSSTMSVLESQERVFALTPQHHYGMFTLSFNTIDAALLLMSTAATYLSDARASMTRIRQILGKALENLSTMADQNALAGTGLSLLTRCYSQMESTLSSLDKVEQPGNPHDLGPDLQGMTQTPAAALESVLWPADTAAPMNQSNTLEGSHWQQISGLDTSMFLPVT